MKIKKVLILKGFSQYDVLRHFCDEMLQSLCSLGCLTTMLDLTSINPEILTSVLFNNYDMIFSFNSIGIELYNFMEHKPLFWSFLVDHPFHHHSRLQQIDGNVMVSCIDRRHVEYIDKYYKNIPWTCFMPHGGTTSEPLRHIPYIDRKYNVVFMGSLGNLQETDSLIKAISNELNDLVLSVTDTAISDMSLDLEQIVYDKLCELNVPFDNGLFSEIMPILSPIDTLRRYYKRLALISSLCYNGIDIDIWGSGWEQAIKDPECRKHIKLHGNVSYSEAMDIMRNSRIVLSDMPLFLDGSHERVFSSMQSGAISATDGSKFLEECFTDNENIIFYRNNNIEELASDIREKLNNPDTANTIINNAVNASADHMWRNRASAMMQIAKNL